MPPSSQQRENIKMENITNEEMTAMAAEHHMRVFVNRVIEAMKDFVKPLNPADGEEEMKYIRSVIESVDNVVATALMVKDDPEAIAMMKASTEILIAQLVKMHNGGEVKH